MNASGGCRLLNAEHNTQLCVCVGGGRGGEEDYYQVRGLLIPEREGGTEERDEKEVRLELLM